MTADNQVMLDDFMCRVPENGVVAIPADLYAKVCDALKLPAINSGGEVERVARAIDPDAWQEDLPVPTRAHTIAFHADRAKSIVKARAALAAMDRAPGVDDSRPDFVGSPQAKIEAYNQMHETAVDLGYPSILEALEALEDLSQPEPRPVEAGEAFESCPKCTHGKLRPKMLCDECGIVFLPVRAAIEHLRQQSLSAARAEIEGLDWKDAKAIAACVVQNACETDPADAEHPDTILITTDDLETIVRSAVEDYEKPRTAALSTDQGREGE